MSGSNEEVEMVILLQGVAIRLREIVEILRRIERNQPNPADHG